MKLTSYKSPTTEATMTTFQIDVIQELHEMTRVGLRVPKNAILLAQNTITMAEYEHSAMSASECCDLLIALA